MRNKATVKALWIELEQKHKKITEEILTRKEELKLLKELLYLKEQNSMNSENIENKEIKEEEKIIENQNETSKEP